MKVWKKTIVILLVLMLSLSGCSMQPVATNPTTTGVVGTIQSTINQDPSQVITKPTEQPYEKLADKLKIDAVPEKDPAITIQYLPQKVENPDNLPVVKWACAVAGYTETNWREAAVHEVNQMLEDKNMPFRIQFVMVSMDPDWYYGPYWYSLPEVQAVLADADLLNGYMRPQELQKYLMPITEYAIGEAEPSLNNAVVHALNWGTGTVDGEIYGTCYGRSVPICHGWMVDAGFMTELGLKSENFNRQYWEMDDLFAQIYEKNGNKPFLHIEAGDGLISWEGHSNIRCVIPHVADSKFGHIYQYIGACFGIDCRVETPTVINTLETDIFRKTRAAIQRYRAAGYTTVSTEEASDVELAQVHYAYLSVREVATDTNGVVWIPVTPSLCDIFYGVDIFSGITAVSQHKEEALVLLNLIAEDETFRDHLLFGKEGRDYTITDYGYSKVRNDGAYYNLETLSPYSAFSAVRNNEFGSYEGNKTNLEHYQESMANIEHYGYPIIFDYTGLETELMNIVEPLGQLIYKFSKLTEEEYDGYLHKLKESGGDKIQAELQRQLDEWLAEHPEWQ